MLREIIKDQNLVTCPPDAKVSEVARMMSEEDVGCVLVLDNDKPRGILTDRDIVIRCIAENVDVEDCTVENVMTESLETVPDTSGVFDCIKKMQTAGVRRIPVVDSQNKVKGIVSFGDLTAILAKEFAILAQGTTHAHETEEIEREVHKPSSMAA